MMILLDPLTADASRATPRVQTTPAPKLWARPARIVEVEFRACCDCFVCNLHKGANLTGIDPTTHRVTALFSPRKNRWRVHFEWNGAILAGRTAIGRTTIAVLNMNSAIRIAIRNELIAMNEFPPT